MPPHMDRSVGRGQSQWHQSSAERGRNTWRSACRVFNAEARHLIRGRLQVLLIQDSVEHIFGMTLQENGPALDVALHVSVQKIVTEVEPSVSENLNSANLVRSMVGRLQQTTGFDTFFRQAARQMRALTGFDRVMVYRFDHDGAGEVIAEALPSNLEPYLELRYPASDIPQQARALYERSWRASSPTEFTGLARFLNRTASSPAFATNELGKIYEPGRDFTERAAGLLAIPISRVPRDFLMFFRREVARTVTWADNPDKPVRVGSNGIRLTPRKSFEAWQETVQGQSVPWTPADLHIAESLRITFIEDILRLTDFAEQERSRAKERQDLLIGELNHRVRNILSLIRGLISQSRASAKSLGGFAALARRCDRRRLTAGEPVESLLPLTIITIGLPSR
jgi:light-regulated signal transduction histidine kinase (bacteriophytochrome)